MNKGFDVIRNIFVVDDDRIQVTYITKILIKEGYNVEFAYDGKTALSYAAINKYDLILLDISLPDIDGFEVCRRLKGQSQTKYIPVIFISGFEDDDVIYQKGFELGAMDYLKKPVTSAELIFKIKNYLRLAKTEAKLRQNEILFRSIVNDQAEFVVRYKPDGTMAFVNTAFSIYMGKSTGELIGTNFFDQLNVDNKDAIRSIVLTTNDPPQISTIQIKRPNGEIVWHQWAQRRIVDRINQKVVIQSIGRDITESKKSEDTLKRYEHIFKNAGGGIATSSKLKYLEQVNEAYAKMHGYTIEELTGKKASIVLAEESDHFLLNTIRKTIKDGNYSYQSFHKRKDGSKFPVLSHLTVLKDENGHKPLLIANVQDISETVAASNALAESERRFRAIFKNSPDVIIIIRLEDMLMVDVNDKFVEYSGCNKEEVLNKPDVLYSFFENPLDMESIILQLKDVDVISNKEVKVRTFKNRIYTVLISCSKIYINGSDHVIAIIRNIQEIKRFQESLQKSETKFRLLADYNYNWEFWLGTNGKYIYVSPSCERISGYSSHEFEKNPNLMMKLFHPDYYEICYDHFINAHLNTDPEISIEMLIIDRDGNEKWISHTCNPVFDENGKFLGRRGNNRDITQKKVSEMELLKLSTAIEQSSSGIVITDPDGVIEYVNPYFEKLTGYKSDEILEKKPSILKSGKTDPKIYVELWESITSGKIWEGELINKKKNEELYIEHSIITPVKDENSRIVNFIAIKQDITKQKEIDREILQTIIYTEEKERSRFAQDLHDDLGPLLSTAKLYIRSFETVKDLKNKQIAINKSLQAIDEAIMSIKEIANNLSPHVLRDFGLISGIKSLINKINETGSIRITFYSDLEERFDENIESSIFRVVAELINNTVKHAFAKQANISIQKTEMELIVNYSDDGIGFELENALNKKLSRGLSNMINRLKSLGGDIVFDPESKGIKVLVTIPVCSSVIAR
jgi:PAS domain S-box-containing protein